MHPSIPAAFSLSVAAFTSLDALSNLAFGQSSVPKVYLNVDANDLSNTTAAFVSRNRLSRAGSVDQMFFLGTNPAGYPASDVVSITGPFNGSSTYNMTLAYTAEDQTYRFSLTNGAVTGNVGFRGAGANSTLSYDASVQNPSYNILHIWGNSTTSGSSVQFSDLVFAPGLGLGTSGSLATSGSASAAGTQEYHQWLAAPTGTNLGDFDWTLSARVKLTAGGTSPSSGEGIKFEFSAKNGTFDAPATLPIPEPSGFVLAAIGMLAGVFRRSRK